MVRWISAALLAISTAATPAAHAQPAPIVTPYADARWTPLDPARPDGPAIAVLWGDPASGPSTMLMRFGPAAAGTAPRLHVHTSDYHLVVIEGRMKHWAAGEREAAAPALGPGSSWFQPGGLAHADACLSERCVMFIAWSGPRDARLAE